MLASRLFWNMMHSNLNEIAVPGMCSSSPIGFAYFGNLLAKKGDIKVGQQFVLLADKLLKLNTEKEASGEVLCVKCETEAFTKPLQTLYELRKRAESESLAAGGKPLFFKCCLKNHGLLTSSMNMPDVHFACINRLQLHTVQLWAGETL